ncbi:CAAX amino protease [Streptomyces chrestomyceticus JCM 4735]|uniref:CAAX amino protease n=1 Tax=Streptomyces chrestomyceticus JCM 4735 TaxID=1306181 RepID=A0A7U9KU79_9ACTN|nr:CPBP family intramembrane glutamic endopeptidase [Streptomyces chrestomyceticus]GCD35396.1 CAAX amino protease [Streptomyces chrestomyceticus JCM 4735]
MTDSAVTVPTDTRKDPLTWPFFGLVFLLLVPCWVGGALIDLPGLPKNAPVTDYVAGFTPALAAVLLTARAHGRAGVRELWRRGWDRRGTGWGWWVPVLLLSPFVYAVTYVLMQVTGARVLTQPAQGWLTVLLFVPVYALLAVGEELGWSGYATEPLQRRWGALRGSLALGAFWWLMHVPSIVRSGQDGTLVALGAFGAVFLRVLWVWIFNNTGGSVFAIIIAHTVANLSSSFVPSVPTAAAGPLVALLGLAVMALWDPATLTRFRGARSRRTGDTRPR